MARNRTLRRRIGASVSLVLLVSLLGVPVRALAAGPLPTLTGETFLDFWSPTGDSKVVAAWCDPTGLSTIEYMSWGTASGPYPGDYIEHGTVTIGAQSEAPRPPHPGPIFGTQGSRGESVGPVLSVMIGFQVQSDNGIVTGSKSLTPEPGAYGVCRHYDDEPIPSPQGGGIGSGDLYVLFGSFGYDAAITADSAQQTDSGTSLLYFEELRNTRDNGSSEGGQFQELYTSAARPPASVTLSPATAVNSVGTTHTVTATVNDAGAGALQGVTVRYTVSGSINASGTCQTSSSGQCDFSYAGPALPGADLIVACADANDNGLRDPDEPCGEATKAWILPSSTAGQVTGGGHVLNPQDGEEVAFGFNAKSAPNGLQGNCTVVDKAPTRNIQIKCLTVDSLVQSANSATLFGQAEVNGVVTNYRIDVVDNGEPGRNGDTFAIRTGSGYSAEGLLDNGNVEVHD